MSVHYRGFAIADSGGDTSNRLIREFIDTPEIAGESLDIRPVEDHDWGLPYETIFGIPDGNPKFTVAPAEIRSKDWCLCQQVIHGNTDEPIPWNEFKRDAYQPTVESVATDIESGDVDNIPTPVLEIDCDGSLNYGEGRSRGVGAVVAGLDWMPLWIAAKDYR